MKPGVDHELAVLRVAFEARGIERIDLRLRPFNRGARLEDADVLKAVAVTRSVRTLLGGKRQGPPEHHLRIQEDEVAWHDADHGQRLSVDVHLTAEYFRIPR